jgi:hypothetical protein
MKKGPGKPEKPKPEGKSSAGKPPIAGKEREAGPFNNPFVKAFRKEK